MEPSSRRTHSFRLPRGPFGRRVRYVYVSYHKCATQYTERVLRAVCRLHGLRAATFDSRHPRVPNRALKRSDFLLLTDYSSDMVSLESLDARGVYVTRDPRDILVSMYYSHRSSHVVNHPEIERDRLALADSSVGPGLIYLMRESRFFRRIMDEMESWDHGHGYHHTTFERLTRDPRREFASMLESLDLGVGERPLQEIVDANSFETLRDEWSERNPEQRVNHYRRGQSGEWRTHLTGDVAAEFDARYGEQLSRLGYARGP